ncbi:hypothetical protein pdam_00002562 [Pocillopora damicornis]|uniref:Uncharacterized protein n=1 Tax=Pocillopora damicornis TaxID=46731 RepID=A0A3M6TRT1_POCDA|nr:hypothetical protein pdam_00002562 [Pocillopora damicornis]
MKLKGRNGAGDWLPLPSKPRFLAQYVEHTSSAPFHLTSPQYHLQFEPGQNQNAYSGGRRGTNKIAHAVSTSTAPKQSASRTPKKLMVCWRIKFSLPQKVSLIEIHISFEKVYWKMEPLLKDSDEKNWLRKNSNPPRALVKALNSLKTRNDIAITKPDKSLEVVVMDRFEYICLLGDASVDNTTKFILVNDKPPKSQEICTLLHEILPNEITEKLSPYSSNSHTYRAYATGTYNHKLANDTFDFTNELRNLSDDILVFYDIASFFINVQLEKTMNIQANKAFTDDWFEIVENSTKLETKVLRKATNTRLQIHFQSPTNRQYNNSLLETMLNSTTVTCYPPQLILLVKNMTN